MKDIDYLKELLKEYDEFNIKRYISVSFQTELEELKDFPEILIWEDLDGRIRVTSKKEYDLMVDSYIKKQINDNYKMPRIIYELNDKYQIMDVLDILHSYKNYDEKLNSLIKLLGKEKELELK